MFHKKRRLLVSIVCIVLAAMIVVPLLLNAFLMGANAASSGELKEQLDELQTQADEIAAQSAELAAQLARNAADTANTVERKALLDQQVEITRLKMENTQAQIGQYNLLIAAKQEELDAALLAEQQMNEAFRLRIRAMEESGAVSYWEILFGARSFSDLLSRVDMIAEIAQADQVMLEQLSGVAAQVEAARSELEAEKANLYLAQDALAVQEQQLAAQRAELDEMLIMLASDAETMEAVFSEYEALEAEILAELSEVNEAYDAALVREEEERRAQQSVSVNPTSGYLYPLPYRCSITDAYGYRWHPTDGNYSFHTGVDFAVGFDVPILAAKSGTVTSATHNAAYGYCVTVLHSDGSYTLYAHMPGLLVSAGQYVSQGETIGYVGSSGKSTGPHLHFGLNIGGTWVNPMDYI